MRYLKSALIMACAACLAQTEAHADSVVVGGDAAAYPPGSIIPAASEIVLQAGETLQYLEKGGTLNTKAGPFSGVLESGAPGGAAAQVISELIKSSGDVRKLGAMRSVGTTDGPAIDLELVGAVFCIADGQGPNLRLSPDTVDREILLEGPGRIEISWPASVAEQPWPPGAPVATSVTYTVWVDDLDTGSFEFREVTLAGDLGSRLTALATAGCETQALALLNEQIGG